MRARDLLILISLLVVSFLLFSPTSPLVTPSPDSGTGSEVRPYVESSFGYDEERPVDAGQPIQDTRQSANRIRSGNTQYSVIETTAGFAVLKLDPATMTVIERVDYQNEDVRIRDLSSPRISNMSEDSFTVTLKATTGTGSESMTFTVYRVPLQIRPQ